MSDWIWRTPQFAGANVDDLTKKAATADPTVTQMLACVMAHCHHCVKPSRYQASGIEEIKNIEPSISATSIEGKKKKNLRQTLKYT